MNKILKHTLLIENEMGLHARPATAIAKLLQNFQSKVTFSCNSLTIDAKQVMDILLLEAKKDTILDIKVEGLDAEIVLKQLLDAFKNQFRRK